MTLSELINNIESLALSHKQIKSAQCGNTFDVTTSKSSEKYPAMWIELPVIIDYNDPKRKTHTLALNFLSLCKSDNLLDAIEKTSDMEVIADEMLQAIKSKYMIAISNISGLTLRNFSVDDLVGVRVDITFTTGRECNFKDSFNTIL